MKIRIWGARGSIPSSIKPAEIEEKICQAILGLPSGVKTRDEQAVRAYVRGLPPLVRGTAGGNTPCVEIQAAGELIAVDAGSGFHEMGMSLLKGPFGRGEGVLHLFISHPHWDHIQGFPMFMPAFVAGNRIFVYGVHDLKKAFEDQQRPFNWPAPLSAMRAAIEFITLHPGEPISIGKVRVNTLRNNHSGHSYSYRFDDPYSAVVYASDAEYKQLDDASIQPHIEFFRGADVLIFDAQYTLRDAWQNKVDWGHSSAMIGVDIARSAGVSKLLLFHHDPTYSDAELLEIQANAIAYQSHDTVRPTCEVLIAYEGLTIEIAPPSAVELQFTPDGEAAILTPISVFDERGVDQLAQQLAHLAEQDTHASSIIDLSQVETLTTATLKALITLCLKRKDAPIVLASPSENIRQVIKLSGYLDNFAIYPSVEDAWAAVQVREALNLPGQVIKERYQIQTKVGEGRLGTVLKATDTRYNQPVALKILSPSFSEETTARFMRQARQIIGLDHPNIVKVLDWDREESYAFKVEEFIEHQTLQEFWAGAAGGDGRLAADQAMEIALAVVRALEYAHSRGVIHSDLKPHNIFLTDAGIKVGGFGLGLLEEGRNLLNAPLIFLTAPYLAPEQILGQPLSAQTDLYALGVLLYQLFTGHLPFDGSDQDVMRAHLHQAPRPPRELNPRISLVLEHVILKLLAKNPADRYTSARQVRSLLSNLIVDIVDSVYPGIAHWPKIELVEREAVQQALQACWEQARAGQGQLAFITGDLGVGKTSLAFRAQQVAAEAEAARRAATSAPSSVFLAGRCPPARVAPPYALFSQILRAYLATVETAALDAQDYQLIGNFIRLIPEARQWLPDLSYPTVLAPKLDQVRLATSVAQFIKRATRRSPWFLVLDDLQWADQSSLELLSHLGRQLSDMSLFIIGTYRDTDLERDHPLLETLRDLRSYAPETSSPPYHQLPVGCLGQASVGQVLANVWTHPGPADLVQKIYAHTDGNPLYVTEIARGLLDDGLVALQDGQWRFPALEEVRLPQDVREAIWRRIRHLSPDAQALLRQASVLGQTFRLDDLKEMSGLSEWEVLDHLDMALERQMVAETPSAQETSGRATFHFCHSEVQDVLYVDLGAPRRRLLHRQAADALLRRAQPDPGRIAEMLAYHFTEAGDLEQAIAYSFQAAQRAEAAYANGAALLWYTQTLEMLDQLKPEQAAALQPLRLAAHKSLGEVLAEIGQYEEALEHYASTLFKWLGKGSSYIGEAEPSVEIVRVYLFGAELYYRQGRYDEAVTWCQKSLDITSRIDTREGQQARGRACYLLGDICMRSGDLPYAVPFFRESLAVYRQISDPVGQADASDSLGRAYYYLGDWAQAEDAYRRSLALRQEIGDLEGQAQTYNHLALILIHRGEWEQASSFLRQAESLAPSHAMWQQFGAARRETNTLNILARVHISQGHWEEAFACLTRSEAIFAEAGSDDYLPELERLWGELFLRTGKLDQALDHALRSVELAVEQNNPLEEGMSCRVLGQVHLARGEWEPAEAALYQSLETLGRLNSEYELAQTRLSIARLAAESGAPGEVREHLAQALRVFEKLNTPAPLADAQALERTLAHIAAEGAPDE